MTVRGQDKRDLMNQKTGSPNSTSVGYEQSFVEKVDSAIPWLAKRGIKLAVNAGASDVAGLAEAVKALIKKHGVDLKVGYVDGDDVTDAVLDSYRKGR
jgi:maltose-binding protein MalE